MDEMKKYIIEFSEDPHTIRLIKIKNGDECPATEFKTVTPYIEPDIEKIRKEAYDEGYQEGMQLSIDDAKLKEACQQRLNDAWDAARKIACDITHGGFHKAYEQEQEQKQEICVGDEIITTSGLYAICSNIDNIKEGWVYLFFDDGSCGAHKIGEIKKKTGKNYPEIVTLLQGTTKT